MESKVEWREVARVVLHENYTILTGRDVEPSTGVFADYEQDVWHVEGDTVDRICAIFGIRSPRKLLDDGIQVNRIPSHCGNTYGVPGKMGASKNPTRIDARIAAPQLLDLRLTWGDAPDEFVQEVTYCGTFTVEWWTE